MAKKILRLCSLLSIMLVSVTSFASSDEARCTNCEAIVELDAAQAERFASVLQIISSMPLHGTVIDPGSSTGIAKVLVATWPNWERGNSFDVANKVLGFAAQSEYGIKTITAVWNADYSSQQKAKP